MKKNTWYPSVKLESIHEERRPFPEGIDISYSCPNCHSPLAWFNAISPLFCGTCLLLDESFCNYDFPQLSDIKLPNSDDNYEKFIYNKMNQLFEKEIQDWSEKDYNAFLKIKKLEDSFCQDSDEFIKQNYSQNDIIPIDLTEENPTVRSPYRLENNPVIKYCLVKHYIKKGQDHIINNLKNSNSIFPWASKELKFKDGLMLPANLNYCLRGIWGQCNKYFNKLERVRKKKDLKDFIYHLEDKIESATIYDSSEYESDPPQGSIVEDEQLIYRHLPNAKYIKKDALFTLVVPVDYVAVIERIGKNKLKICYLTKKWSFENLAFDFKINDRKIVENSIYTICGDDDSVYSIFNREKTDYYKDYEVKDIIINYLQKLIDNGEFPNDKNIQNIYHYHDQFSDY